MVCLVGSLFLALALPIAVPLLLLGIAMLFASRRWTPLDKAIASVAYVLLGVPFVLLIALLVIVGGDGCASACQQGSTTFAIVSVPVWLVGQACVFLHLVRRAFLVHDPPRAAFSGFDPF